MNKLFPILIGILFSSSAIALELKPSLTKQSLNNEKVFALCRDIGVLQPDSAMHDFTPLMNTLMEAMGESDNGIYTPARVAKMGLKIILLEAPKHGKIKDLDVPGEIIYNHMPDGKVVPFPLGSRTYTYTLIADLNYLGKDRVVYKVEAYGKSYKSIINFMIVAVVGESKGEDDPYLPECMRQKFDD